jgi:predicted ester cyclase
MPADSNARAVHHLFEDLINGGHLDRLGEVVGDDFVGPNGQPGPAGFASTIAALRSAFPDIVYTLDAVVAGGDRVAVRWTWRGTHRGAFRSFAPTGAVVANRGFAIFELAGGKIVRGWVETDRLGFLLAIGAIPDDPAFGPPQAAPAAK